MNIVVCEDEEVIRKKIQLHVNKLSLRSETSFNIVLSTGNPYEVFEYINNNPVDTLILDIDLKRPDMDGIKLGNKLRELDKNIIIIFLSSRLERIFESFSCIPFDFVAKPAISPRLEEALEKVAQHKQHAPHGNFVRIKNTILNLDQVIYIEKQLSKSIFYTTRDNVEIYITFIDLTNCLTENFLQISKSFIINLDYITSINESTKVISLRNGENLKYSAKYVKDIGGILNGSNH